MDLNTHIHTNMREKTRSVGQRFGYASDHFKDSRNEKIKKRVWTIFLLPSHLFFPFFQTHAFVDRQTQICHSKEQYKHDI